MQRNLIFDDENTFKQIIDQTFNAIVITDANLGRPGPYIEYANPAFEQMTGYTLKELKGRSPRILQGDRTDYAMLSRLKDACEKGEVFQGHTVNYKKDGTPYYVHWNISPLRDDAGTITHYVSVQEDITMQVHTSQYLQRVIDMQNNILIISNGDNIQFANKKFFSFFDYKDLQAFKKDYECVCELFIQNDNFFHLGLIEKEQNWLHEIQELPQPKQRVAMENQQGILRVFSVNLNHFEQDLFIITFTDITQTVRHELLLEQKSIHDSLTNLYNREFFEQIYQDLIDRECTGDTCHFALAIGDIDHFKAVNDDYGHDIGDEVLQKIASLMRNSLREEDLIIRWGGEEFLLIVKVSTKEKLKVALEHLRQEIAQYSFHKAGTITCSFGATGSIDTDNIKNSIKRADNALYKAKQNGRNRVVID